MKVLPPINILYHVPLKSAKAQLALPYAGGSHAAGAMMSKANFFVFEDVEASRAVDKVMGFIKEKNG